MPRRVIYRHTPEMGEISGFGGSYEGACQDMLQAGVEWLEKRSSGGHPAKLELRGFEGVYGLLIPESNDAKRLEEIITEAATSGGKHPEKAPTGAMLHAVLSRLFFISQHGWDAYATKLSASKEVAK